jgi:threonine dehydrogenase-like Zn-dependent dehydrogenase
LPESAQPQDTRKPRRSDPPGFSHARAYRPAAPQTIGIGADRASALMEKGLQLHTGQTHVHRYLPKRLAMIEQGKLDTTFLISHRLPLEEALTGYKNFKEKQDSWTKVVLKPGTELAGA